MCVAPSRIVHNLDILGTGLRPAKANAPLVVNADAVLAFSVAVERFEAISGRRLQEIEGCGSLHL
jgi:hypothetical protein